MYLFKRISTDIKTIVFLVLAVIFFYSCRSENKNSIRLLQEAQRLVENDPKQAFIYLDSITDPQNMSVEHYNQYSLTSVQCKVKNNQIISNDTTIMKVIDYFEKNKNDKYAALANFYAGTVNLRLSNQEKAVECYFRAVYYSNKIDDNILTSKVFNNLGYLYYMQEMPDSAIINYQRGLEYLDNSEPANINYRRLISNLGVAFELAGKYDSAVYYFNKSLDVSNMLKDNRLEASSLYNLGIMSYQRGLYADALKNFDEAFFKIANTRDSLRIYYMKSKVFFAIDQVDSTKYYTNILNTRLSEISDNDILEDYYRSFSDYNRQQGNYEEALRYADLEKEINNKRQLANKSSEILTAEKKASVSLLQKKQDEEKQYIYYYIAIILPIFFLVIFVLRFEYKKYKKEAKFLKKEIARIKKLPDLHRENEKLYEWARVYLDEFLDHDDDRIRVNNLSHQETLVLALLCNQYSDEVIAAILNIQVENVVGYRTRFKYFMK